MISISLRRFKLVWIVAGWFEDPFFVNDYLYGFSVSISLLIEEHNIWCGDVNCRWPHMFSDTIQQRHPLSCNICSHTNANIIPNFAPHKTNHSIHGIVTGVPYWMQFTLYQTEQNYTVVIQIYISSHSLEFPHDYIRPTRKNKFSLYHMRCTVKQTCFGK